MDNTRSEMSNEIRELRARATEQLVGNEYYMVAQQLDSLESSPELTGETAKSVLEMLRARLGSAERPDAPADSDGAAAAASEPEAASGNPDFAVASPRANSFGMPQATGATGVATEPETEIGSEPEAASAEVPEPPAPGPALSRLQAAVEATRKLATEHLDGNNYYMAAKLLDGLRDLPAADRKGASITAPENFGDAVTLLRQEIEQLGSIARDQAAPMLTSLQALVATGADLQASAIDAVQDAAAAARRETMEALDTLRAEDEPVPAEESSAADPEPTVEEQVVSFAKPALEAAAAAKRETIEALDSLRADLDADAETDMHGADAKDAVQDDKEPEPEPEAEKAADVSDDAETEDSVGRGAAAAEAEPEIAAAETETAGPDEELETEAEPEARTGFDDLAEAAWRRVREVSHDDVAIALNGTAVHASVVASSSPAPRPAPAAPQAPAASVHEPPAPSAVPPVVEETPAAPAPAATDVDARESDEALNDGGSERRSSGTEDDAQPGVPAAASGDPEPSAETGAAEASAEAVEGAPPAETVEVETVEAARLRDPETPDSAAATASAALENIARTEAPLVADEVRVAPDAEPAGAAAEVVETAVEASAEAVAAVEAAMETVADADVEAVAQTAPEAAPASEPSAKPAEAERVAEEPAVSPVETVAAEAAAQQEPDIAPSAEPEPVAASVEPPKPAAPEAEKQPEKPAKKGFFARLFGG